MFVVLYVHVFVVLYVHVFVLLYVHVFVVLYVHVFVLLYFHVFVVLYVHVFVVLYFQEMGIKNEYHQKSILVCIDELRGMNPDEVSKGYTHTLYTMPLTHMHVLMYTLSTVQFISVVNKTIPFKSNTQTVIGGCMRLLHIGNS